MPLEWTQGLGPLDWDHWTGTTGLGPHGLMCEVKSSRSGKDNSNPWNLFVASCSVTWTAPFSTITRMISRRQVRHSDGSLRPMEESSQFIRHLARIERFRIYTPPEVRREVA